MISKVNQVISALETEGNPSLDEETVSILNNKTAINDIESSSQNSIGTMADLVEDLKVFTECLVELIPSLESPANDQMIPEETGHTISHQLSDINHLIRPFVLAIEDKYPLAEHELVLRIGEAVYRRHERFRTKRLMRTTSEEVQIKYQDNESIHSKTSGAETKHGRRSDTTKSSFAASSVFDEAYEVKDDDTKPQIVRRQRLDSMTSARTSIGTGVPKAGSRRVPNIPKAGRHGGLFKCFICDKLVEDMRTRNQWKYETPFFLYCHLPNYLTPQKACFQ